MLKDIITAVMKIITEVIVTRSIPKLNFVLSFAISNENSPIESITMPENMLCSPLKFTKIDVDDNPKTPSKYGIRGVPTLIVFKNGQVFKQSVGDLSVENLKSFLNSAL